MAAGTAFIGPNNGGVYDWFKIMDAENNVQIKTIPSQLESGSDTIDNKCIVPQSCRVTGYVHLNDTASLASIDSKIEGKSYEGSKMSVTTKDGVFNDMMPISMRVHSDKENFEYVEVTIQFQELMDDSVGLTGDDSNTERG
ncbi:MAG: hypothetical protein MJZ81_07300 [Bacteroidales bacterium]|nr:hypothetical protein [Bacteroidales bacterium]